MCYVLGANPPSHVIGGFVRRFWRNLSIDKVVFKPNGICLVRFKKMEDKEVVLSGDPCFFDNKPFIVKSWSINEPVVRDKVDVVPIWVRFYNLDLKLWGAALTKIAGLVGKPICPDTTTNDREFLGFARFMGEVQMGHQLPDFVEFFDENRVLVKQPVHYEWKPTVCTSCHGMGHESGLCKKIVPKKKAQVQQTVQIAQVEQVQLPQIDPNVVVTPMPVRGNQVLNSMSSARIFNRLSKRKEGFSQGGPSFVEVLSLSLRRNLLNSLGKGRIAQSSEHGFFGLLETRVKTRSINKVQSGMGNTWQFIYNNDVREGGRIWIVWDTNLFDVVVLDKSAQVVHLSLTCIQNAIQWHCSVVYGFNKNADRRAPWQSLLDIHSTIHGPWMIMGDFNNVLSFDERIGAAVTMAEVKDLQDCVDSCGLYDLSSTGAYFTWNNKQEGDERVFSRIDRVMANDEWILNGPDGGITFLPEGLYDHSPCLIEFWTDHTRQKPSFKYFNMWGKHEQFKDIVQKAWQQDIHGCRMFQVVKKLKWLKQPLKKLNKEGYGDIKNAAKTFKELDEARLEFLAKKAKTQWFHSSGDNTNYFHSTLKTRRAQNKVLKILDMNGHMCIDNATIEHAFLDYYKMLLGSSASVTEVCPGVVKRGALLTDVQARDLLLEVTDEEIKKALFSIPKEKAPGSDGYSSQFFKDAFEVVGCDVVAVVKEFFQSGDLLSTATVLPSIVSMNQGAFIQDDLLLFCKGDYNSVKVVMRGFITFSEASGLCMNQSKSDLYMNGARVILLPKGVIGRVEAICRNYLWSHAENYSKVPLISWEKCCLPQNNGGLGILNAAPWNTAMLDGYSWLLGHHLKVPWSSFVWNRVAIPKVTFINWLYINHRLLTKDRMGRFGIVSDGLCFLCGSADETMDHLFFYCWFSRCCLRLVQLWLPAPWQPNVVEWIIKWRCRSLLKN
ncbi:uncharacterized protein LOC141638873 [Silene latifolia]|uniref:uncharacterized protein LOC141638873 n=1 Tax=Silene latifolia TaxID=37657 RepID=UPI003D779679